MRMLRWMCGCTKVERTRNGIIKGMTEVGEISKKVQERRLKWYGHVIRRDEEWVSKRVKGDRCAREEKERKTEAKVDEQHHAQLD